MFSEVLENQRTKPLEVEPNVTSGDFLQGFFLGTRQALFENNRDSMTLVIPKVSPFSVGVLIALFERAVGFYAPLINVNAYHQPGVEAGKKAAATILELQLKILRYLETHRTSAKSVSENASGIGNAEAMESVFKICEHLAVNPSRGLKKVPGKSPFESTCSLA